MTKKLLICFVGLDGSGKTTQAEKLVENLKRNRIKARYVWNRSTPLLLGPLLKLGDIIFFRKKPKYQDYGKYLNIRKNVFKVPGLNAFVEFLTISEYLIQTWFYMGVLKVFRRTIICDRYYYDVVAGLAADFDYNQIKTKQILNLFESLLPKPNLVFLIDVPEKIAFDRKEDIPSIAFLKKRRDILLEMAKNNKIVVLNGTANIEELGQSILDKTKRLMESEIND